MNSDSNPTSSLSTGASDSLIYLDHNATQPVAPEALEAMLPWFQSAAANPSSRHQSGERVRVAFEDARERMARVFGCRASELTFTSGATESLNWALRGVMAVEDEPGHLVTSTVEHSVTEDIANRLEAEGHRVTRLEVEDDGSIDPARVDEALAKGASLLSLIWVNNETGVKIDVDKIGEIARKRGVPFHVDAVQVAGKVAGLFEDSPVDMLTFGGHKFGSAKGSGGLIVRRGTRIRPFIWGGHQEKARRSGTENVPGVMGMAAALEASIGRWTSHREEVGRLRDRLEAGLWARVGENIRFNGREADRIENTSSVCFRGIEGAAMVVTMSQHGVELSSGSACSAFDPGPSSVLKGMRVPGDFIHGAIRFSLGTRHSEAEIDRAIEVAASAWDHVSRVNTL